MTSMMVFLHYTVTEISLTDVSGGIIGQRQMVKKTTTWEPKPIRNPSNGEIF